MPTRQGWLNGWIRAAGFAAVAAGMISASSRTSLGDGAAASARRFDMRLQSSLKLQKAGTDGVKTLEATTRLVYDRTERPGSLDIAVHAMEIELKEDGRKTFDTTMTRAAITTHRGEATDEELYETPKGKPPTVPAIRRMLETFDTTAVTLTFDASGKELTRTPKISGPLADKILSSLDLLLSVQPPFPARDDRWETPATLRLDQGRAAQGTLTFEKSEAAANQVRVKVTGRLAAVPGGAKNEEARTGSYTIRGEQVYDLTERAWKSAHWSIDMTFDVVQNGKPAGSASGTVKLTMNLAKPDLSNRSSETEPTTRKAADD